MRSTHQAELDIPTLPPAARTIHIFPDLQNGTLLSIGQLCDAGCDAHFTKDSVVIKHNGTPVLHGQRTGSNGLWYLTEPQHIESLHEANDTRPAFLPASTKAADIVAFMHAALGSPAFSTLCKAIDAGYIHGIPGLTSRTVRNHPPFSIATVKGHQDQARKNVQSTKPKKTFLQAVLQEPAPEPVQPETVDKDDYADTFLQSDTPNERTHFCFLGVEEITGQVSLGASSEFSDARSLCSLDLQTSQHCQSNHLIQL